MTHLKYLFFCVTNSSKRNDIQSTISYDKEKQKLFTFQMLEAEYFASFA